jgi:hypothetical protein
LIQEIKLPESIVAQLDRQLPFRDFFDSIDPKRSLAGPKSRNAASP